MTSGDANLGLWGDAAGNARTDSTSVLGLGAANPRNQSRRCTFSSPKNGNRLPGSPGMISVAEFNDIDRLRDLRLLWKELLGKTGGASFFQSLDWLTNYWRHFGENMKLRCLVVSVAGRPIGIVPFIVKHTATHLGRVRVLTYPLDSWGAFYGPIGPHPAATLNSALRYIRASRRDWELIDLRYVDVNGTDRGRTRNAMRNVGLQSFTRHWNTDSLIELGPNWTEFLAQLDPTHRKVYRCAEERLEQLGHVEYVRHRPGGRIVGDDETRDDLYDSFRSILTSRSTDGRQDDGRNRFQRIGEFLSDVHGDACRAGAADLNLLFLDDRPVCAVYNYVLDGRVETVSIESADDAPAEAGLVLMGRMLRDGCRRNDDVYVVASRLGNPSGWQTSTTTSARYTHFPVTVPRAQVFRLNQHLKRWFAGKKSPATQPPKHEPAADPVKPRLSVIN